MRTGRIHALATLASCALFAAPAQAGRIPLLGGGTRLDPGVAARDISPVPPHRAVRSRTYAKAGDGPVQQLQRMRDREGISPAEYRLYRDEFRRSEAFARGLEAGARRNDMYGVLANIRSVAARGMLKPSRLEPLWLNLRRNREWWSSGPLLASGARVSFEGSEVVFQYFPGEGLQFHPLANFGKLNALVTSRADGRSRRLMEELLGLGAWRSGALAWEYYFDFGGGAPAWVSSLSQGTALQALSRAAARAGVASEVFPELWHGLKVFQRRTPRGVRVPVSGPGDHYAQYSFAPSLRILNGFIQSLNGLEEFADQTGFELARELFEAGEARARVEVPTYDTGAWSLYARGSSHSESSLEYHVLLRDFLEDLCDRTAAPVHCRAEENFTRYLAEPPALRLKTRHLVAGRPGSVAFSVSKISSVVVALYRGDRRVYAFSGALGFGGHSLAVRPPRSARGKAYDVRMSATDLAGNRASERFTLPIRRK